MAAFPPQLPPGAPSALPPPDAGGAPPASQGPPPGGGSPLGALADKGGSGGSLLQLILTFLAGMGGATLLDQLPKLMSKMAPKGAKGMPPQGGGQMPPGQMPPQVAAQLAQLAQRGG